MAGKDLRVFFNFDTEEGEKINIKFALSPVSTSGALANLVSEIPHWDFNQVREEATSKWNKELGKIEVNSLTEDHRKTF